jgi:broad specificity phosphatase PhoE
MPTTRLWLIRHAEVESRYQQVFGGRIDMELSALGHLQAAALARYLQHFKFDACYASPMKRVRQTLAPITLAGVPQPHFLDGLREVDFGDWTGLAWHEVKEKYGISAFAWLDQLECAGIQNAECSVTFRARVEPCLKQILEEQAGKQVALVCHGGVIRMVMAILLGVSLRQMVPFHIEYASLTQIFWLPGNPELRLVNFTPWRDLAAHGGGQ